jgi:hypothetical protein
VGGIARSIDTDLPATVDVAAWAAGIATDRPNPTKVVFFSLFSKLKKSLKFLKNIINCS